jgi:hypothetical protein
MKREKYDSTPIEYHCERCHVNILINRYRVITFSSIDDFTNQTFIDLCESCYGELALWIKAAPPR